MLRSGARVAAAQSLALSISPPLLEVMIKPGKSITQVYKLTNNGEPTIVTIKLVELGANGIKEDTDFLPDKWISILSNDLVFDKPFLLGRDKTAEFLLKVNPPAGSSEQDYYRALVFTTTPQAPIDTTMTSFVQNLVSPVLITVTASGATNKVAQITKFDLPVFIDSFDTLVTDIEVKNTGKTYFRPIGKIALTGPVGRGSFDLIPQVLMSDQTKKLATEHPPPQNEDDKTLYLPGFYIGKYQLSVNFSLDESKTTVSKVKTFYAVPWKAGLVLLTVLIVVLWKKSKRKK